VPRTRRPPVATPGPAPALSQTENQERDSLSSEAHTPDGTPAHCAFGGIESRVFDAAPGRRSLVASYGPPRHDALVLSAHLDVVPADPAHLAQPPLEVVEADSSVTYTAPSIATPRVQRGYDRTIHLTGFAHMGGRGNSVLP